MALTSKQQVWLEEYFSTWNATEAARRAGYAHPRQAGAENVSNVVIAEEIQSRIAEKTMTADEALVRLAEQARAAYADYIITQPRLDLIGLARDGKLNLVPSDMGPTGEVSIRSLIKAGTLGVLSNYLLDSRGSVDLETMKLDGKMHLVKKVKPTKYGLEVEFHDAQTALVNIGRHHKLFTDGLDLGGEVKFSESESAAERITSRLDSIVTRIRAQSSPSGTSTDTTGSSST